MNTIAKTTAIPIHFAICLLHNISHTSHSTGYIKQVKETWLPYL